MTGAGAAALDGEPLPGRHKGGITLLLVAAEEGGDRHMQGPRQRLQGVERGRGHAVLDLREHAGREIGELGEIGDGHVELLAELAHLAADSDLELGMGGAHEAVRVLELGSDLGARYRSNLRGGTARPRRRRSRFAVALLQPPPANCRKADQPTAPPSNSAMASSTQVQRYRAEALSASR